MVMKLAVTVNTLANAFVYLIFGCSVVAIFLINGFVLGIIGGFIMFLILRWIIGLLDDLFNNWEKGHQSRV